MRITHRGGPLDRDPDTPWLSVKPEPGNRVVGIWTTGHGFAVSFPVSSHLDVRRC